MSPRTNRAFPLGPCRSLVSKKQLQIGGRIRLDSGSSLCCCLVAASVCKHRPLFREGAPLRLRCSHPAGALSCRHAPAYACVSAVGRRPSQASGRSAPHRREHCPGSPQPRAGRTSWCYWTLSRRFGMHMPGLSRLASYRSIGYSIQRR